MKHKGKRFYKENKKAVSDVKAKTDVKPENIEPDNIVPQKIKPEKKEKPLKVSKSKVKPPEKAEEKAPKEQSKLIDFKKHNQTEKKSLKKSKDFGEKSAKFQEFCKVNKKNIFLSALIIMVLLLTVFLFTNRDRLSFSNIKNFVQYGVLNMESEEHFPVSTQGDVISNGNFTRIDNNLVFASDTHFVTMNSYGRAIYNYPQSFSNPVLVKAADCDLSLVYNLGGKEFFVNTIDSTIFTGEAEDNILVADIAKDGTYAIVTEKDGYLSKLFVYSSDNQQIFAYSFADYYITSLSIDSKGKTAVLSGISAHDGSQIGCVYVLNFTKEEPVLFKEFENNVLYFVDHLSNNYACIIGENATYTLNVMTKSFETVEYDSKTLTAFDINTDTNNFVLSLSRSGDGRMCDILTFSNSGKLRKTIATELEISAISTYKNRILALSGDSAYLYSKDGMEISSKEAGLDPHAVVLYSTTDAYVLGVSEIRRIDL